MHDIFHLFFFFLENGKLPSGSIVNNPSANPGDASSFLCWKYLLKRKMGTHSSVLAWEIPIDRGAWWATVHGHTRKSHTT